MSVSSKRGEVARAISWMSTESADARRIYECSGSGAIVMMFFHETELLLLLLFVS